MSPAAIALALSAAMLHAGWNAFLRGGADRFWTLTVMGLTGAAVALPAVLALPLPAPAAWPFLALSVTIQVGYGFLLAATYGRGELGQVYPIVRGSVPILVTAGGVLFAGEHPGGLRLLGVALIAAGIASLALGRGRATVATLMLAITAGMLIATYAVVDAAGVRAAGAGAPYVAAYVSWVLLLYGIALPAVFLLWRGRPAQPLRSAETARAVGGGLVALLGYGLVLAAFAIAPAGPVTALRETNVVFAALLGHVFLGERLTLRRLLACALVALGVILIALR
ncbi:EamA family transporter [Ancylobacter terrae]|uniref:EamA family transporter n=1 Tax=Ancylobacter sp. sgz301288 TaxID=3342077 RepID=UPI00385B8193